MKCVELNAKGHFDLWEPEKIEELRNKPLKTEVSNTLVFENETLKLWYITLAPYERLPFREQKGLFTYTCLTSGLAITRYSDARINLVQFNKGDTEYLDLEETALINDLENIGEDVLIITVLEHKETVITTTTKQHKLT